MPGAYHGATDEGGPSNKALTPVLGMGVNRIMATSDASPAERPWRPRPRLTAVGAAFLLAFALVGSAAFGTAALAQGHHAIATSDGLDAWAVGDSGRCDRTLDGGVNWGSIALGSGALRAVSARGFRVVIAGDSGQVWRSTNAGGTWTLATIPGAPALRAIDLADDLTGFLVGDAGTVVRMSASGAVLTPLASGLGGRLDAVRFTDPLHGWVVGAGGLAARTADGGVSWTRVSLPTTRELTGVDVAGGTVWIVGERGSAFRSTDGGGTFTSVELGLDSGADVRTVHLATPDTVWLAGGGGFLRVSTDAGVTWRWPVHPLQGPVGGLAFGGTSGFLCGTHGRAVIHSTDRGMTWALPAGTVTTRSWKPRLTFGTGILQVRGNTLALNPVDRDVVQCLIGFSGGGVQRYRSGDAGVSWTPGGPPLVGPNRASAFVISPRDTNVMLALVTDPPQLLRSTDAGASWTARLTRPFGEFGVPLAMHPLHPDTLFFGGDTSGVWRSLDRGDTWTPWGSTVFREPCDLEVVPDSTNLLLLDDGNTASGFGEGWRSTDDGASWSLRYTGTGLTTELPELAVSRVQPAIAYMTAWRTGGTLRSTDRGASWSSANPSNPAWAVSIAGDDPNVVVLGMFGGGLSYLTLDGGTSWLSVPLPNASYAMLARDRGTILAEQSTGIYQYDVTHAFPSSNAQTLTLTSPVGGESWNPHDVHDIIWNPTQIAIARLEYRSSPGESWSWIADVAGDRGRYAWTVPATPGSGTEVRVSDAWDGSPADSSAAPFTITTVAVGEAAAPEFALASAQPNPFTRATTIRYTLPMASHVRLELFGVRGERVATLVDAWQPAGSHAVAVDEETFRTAAPRTARPAGIYFVRLDAGSRIATRKLIRLR